MTTVLRISRPSAYLRMLPYAGAAAVTALVLAACGGGGGSNTAAPVQGSTPAPTATGGNGGGQGQRQPGVTGLIAAVNGTTMQVQTRTDQTAVSWTDATTFTKTAPATLADVTVGSCVTAIDMSSPGASASPTTAPTEVTASNVQVRPATNGECTGGFGGAGGPGAGPAGGASGAPTAPPTRTGTGAPGDGRQGNGFGGRAVQGKVTAVSGGTITVEETLRGRGQGTATGSATTGTQQTVTVTTNGSTTFAAEKAAAASDVTVGECATALGKADDTGAVAATAISLRPATNGSCTGGGAGGGRGATGTATTATTSATSATKGA